MTSWHSYPSIFNLGHRAIQELLTVPVNIEEKVDGSQFSFSVSEDGELRVRSKGAVMHVDAPEKMFAAGVKAVKDLADRLTKGWTYRGEYLAKPRHNALNYSRVPAHHTIIFDINDGEESYLDYDAKRAECERIGLECVPLLFSGIPTMDTIRGLLVKESVLGGQPIEGVVIKPAAYGLYGADKKVLLGKFVSESCKEVHAGAWREANPTKSDILDRLTLAYRTPARWQKAVLHLAEQGQITDSPRDIGPLLKEVGEDVERECESEIKQILWDYAWPQLRRRIIHGLPEWYKELLLKKQFEDS